MSLYLSLLKKYIGEYTQLMNISSNKRLVFLSYLRKNLILSNHRNSMPNNRTDNTILPITLK
jgi:hypothetical protein